MGFHVYISNGQNGPGHSATIHGGSEDKAKALQMAQELAKDIEEPSHVYVVDNDEDLGLPVQGQVGQAPTRLYDSRQSAKAAKAAAHSPK